MQPREKIPDIEVEKISIKECNEEMVSIKNICPSIIINNPSTTSKVKEESKCLRKTVAEKLCNIQKKLQKKDSSYSLVINWGFRSCDTQGRGYKDFYEKFRKENPSLTEEEIKEKTNNFIASPEDETPPHATGAAVDLTIAYKNKSSEEYEELDMGTEMHSTKEEDATLSENLSEEQKKNRRFLIDLMEEEGFMNYPVEWWHWSYKDKYWAAEKGQEYAEYGPVEKISDN